MRRNEKRRCKTIDVEGYAIRVNVNIEKNHGRPPKVHGLEEQYPTSSELGLVKSWLICGKVIAAYGGGSRKCER